MTSLVLPRALARIAVLGLVVFGACRSIGVRSGGGEVCATWTAKRYNVDSGEVVNLLPWEKCFRVP